MNSYRILAVATASVLGLGLSTGIALAQGPNSDECNEATFALVKAEEKLKLRIAEDLTTENAALETAKRQLREARALPNEDDPATEPNEVEVRRVAIDTAQGAVALAEKNLAEDSNAVVRLRAEVNAAIEARDEACADTEPTPPATTTPAPPPAFVDLDCADFADQAAAQAKLNETPNDDPHNLDANNNRVACEVDELNPVDDDDNAPLPSGGVDTGDGSSL